MEGGPTTERGVFPLHASSSHTGGAMQVCTCTHHTHTHKVPGVHSFHREGEVKVGG